MRRSILSLAVLCALLLAACGGDTEEPERTEEPEAPAAAIVEVADSDHGDILVDPDGMTLYMFVPDQDEGEPTCYEDCAATWPPVEVTADPTAGEGVDQSLLGTAERTDGSTQLTYNDLPLYLFSGDAAGGDTNGQGLNDVWWVVSPTGDPVMD